MKLKQLLTDDDAVSPVIGVILMVAITVILAAVIGTFVLGIGQNQQTTPSATIEWDYESGTDNATAIHNGGQTFNSENTGELRAGEQGSGSLTAYTASNSMPFEAGNTWQISCDTSCDSGDKLVIIWEANSGDRTSTVSTYTIP